MKKIQKHFANCITTLGIISGIIACIVTKNNPSWVLSELLFIFSLLTDALDGKVARKFGSTKAGPYLDDIADFINFGIHPGLWIWIVSGEIWLGIGFALCIFLRLVRFTLLKQNISDTFLGLPSPASALAVFGLVFVQPESQIFVIGIVFIAFLSLSQIRFIHVMKYTGLATLRLPMVAVIILLPFLFGLNEAGIGITHLTISGIYLFFSLLFLIPKYRHD